MNDLNIAVARIALEVHPDRIDAICSALSKVSWRRVQQFNFFIC
jgi:hypothetical protein